MHVDGDLVGHHRVEARPARAELTAELFPGVPLFGVVGGLHYPVPHGRGFIAGVIDVQRRLASGTSPLDPLDEADVDAELAMLGTRNVGLVSIGGHDSSDEAIERARARFGAAWRDLRVGEPIVVAP